jgi:hypothetical protein
MSKYRLKNVETGNEHVVDCNRAQLETRVIGGGPAEVGARVRSVSRLDGSEVIHEIVGVAATPISTFATWDRGFRDDQMGINPDDRIETLQADEAMGLTGVDYDPETGEAIFSCPSAYKRYCEAHGFGSKNAGYSSPKMRDEREREIMHLPQLPETAQPDNQMIFMDR